MSLDGGKTMNNKRGMKPMVLMSNLEPNQIWPITSTVCLGQKKNTVDKLEWWGKIGGEIEVLRKMVLRVVLGVYLGNVWITKLLFKGFQYYYCDRSKQINNNK